MGTTASDARYDHQSTGVSAGPDAADGRDFPIARLEAVLSLASGPGLDMAMPQFYPQPGEKIADVQKQLTERKTQLAKAFTRWEELE